jgi:hypothetical protein
MVAVDWGPWATSAGGMVTVELERRYAKRGIGLIEPDDGVSCLLRELAYGTRDDVQVMYSCAEPAAFELRPGEPLASAVVTGG